MPELKYGDFTNAGPNETDMQFPQMDAAELL